MNEAGDISVVRLFQSFTATEIAKYFAGPNPDEISPLAKSLSSQGTRANADVPIEHADQSNSSASTDKSQQSYVSKAAPTAETTQTSDIGSGTKVWVSAPVPSSVQTSASVLPEAYETYSSTGSPGDLADPDTLLAQTTHTKPSNAAFSLAHLAASKFQLGGADLQFSRVLSKVDPHLSGKSFETAASNSAYTSNEAFDVSKNIDSKSLSSNDAVSTHPAPPLSRAEQTYNSVSATDDTRHVRTSQSLNTGPEPHAPVLFPASLDPGALEHALEMAFAVHWSAETVHAPAVQTISGVVFNAAMMPGWPFPSALVRDTPNLSNSKAALQQMAGAFEKMTPEESAQYLAQIGAQYSALRKLQALLKQLDRADKRLLKGLLTGFLDAVKNAVVALQTTLEQLKEMQKLQSAVNYGEDEESRHRLKL